MFSHIHTLVHRHCQLKPSAVSMSGEKEHILHNGQVSWEGLLQITGSPRSYQLILQGPLLLSEAPKPS
jgi:hypothetical protein